jgi:hypothetical protein
MNWQTRTLHNVLWLSLLFNQFLQTLPKVLRDVVLEQQLQTMRCLCGEKGQRNDGLTPDLVVSSQLLRLGIVASGGILFKTIQHKSQIEKPESII